MKVYPANNTGRVKRLENTILRLEIFEEVSTTSGVLSVPAGGTIVLDPYTEDEDALCTVIPISGQRPIEELERTPAGAVVTVALSGVGNSTYTLSGTPSGGQYAIQYVIDIQLVNYKDMDRSVILATEDVLSPFEVIKFDINAGIDVAEGELAWNVDDGTVNIGMPGGEVVGQVLLEGLIRVSNKSGSDIANGKLVCVTGSQGNRLTIGLSDKTDPDTFHILGMVTENIDDNSNGYVALWGDVRGDTDEPINTSGLVEGDKLYLSTTGDWVNTHPASATAGVIVIGEVRKVHATDGIIYLERPEAFSIGNNFNGTMRQTINNKSTGTSAAAGFTAVNDNNHFTTIGIAGSGNTTFTNEVSVHYAPGYGDHWMAVDGNKDFVWFTDPTDSHNNSSLNNEVMRLQANGNLGIGTDSPEEPLHVIGTIKIEATDEPAVVVFFNGVNNGQFGSDFNKYGGIFRGFTSFGGILKWSFNSVTGDGYVAGNLGIGTTSPDANLQIGDRADTIGWGTLNNSRTLLIGPDESYGIGIIEGTVQANILMTHSGADTDLKAFNICTASGATEFRSLNDDGSINQDNIIYMRHDNGNVGIGTNDPSQPLSVKEKSCMTAIGGFAVKLTNKTGANSVAGQIVEASSTTDDAFGLTSTNDDHPIGVVLEAGVADGSEAWIVTNGIADTLIDAAGCTHGDRMVTSATAGSASTNNAPAVAVHFQEIGHSIETRVGAGLARVVLHFL